jgi:hypothetical protein
MKLKLKKLFKKNTEEKSILSEDTKQRIKSYLLFILEFFKVLMATLLAVFVPQHCPDSLNGECTMSDNFTDLTNLNKGVLAVNFLTLFMFLIHYIVEVKRENWCIEYLDVDPSKPDINLKTELEQYPEYKKKMIEHNTRNYKWIKAVSIVNVANIIISGIMIFGYYYLDYKTITGFLTNILLIADKIYNSMSTAVQSVEEFLPFSSYMKMPVLFNTIDGSYKKNEETEIEIHQDNSPRELNVETPTETEGSNGPAINTNQIVIEVNFD